ncbi:RHS repeat domain-containing protein [Butyrivibrio sp. M55]|uniref:RHS repeat domain-containing protein n=1 Tax=Butyrivibrio sp. M55 TaxID=1855323 RepID=UPI001587EC3A|nr:RHS repeat-associated core domain-containing protein [Butyrivibrio sp. M55]
MTSTDKQGVLDKYFYSYNNSGLISGIDRNRRGLDMVSGRYEYSYDAIGRLTKTTHDGITKAAYEYDAFGNRTSMSETETKTSYTYDVLDRLVEAKELNNSQAILKTYDYDKRGNQTKEFIDGLLQKTFTFDATNMLSKVVDKDKGELENHYNGLGFRVASTRPEEKIEYLCDLSKDYYNLLERTVNGETESFVYDNNVISMSKSGNNFYYLQDELGSPMYMTGTDGVAVSSYAFDDFGRNIDPFTGKQKKHGYTKQGNIIQPFAFTGYQEDEVSGLKFAQARYYSVDNGRFQSEDKVKGFIDSPFTINHYGYCWGNPIGIVDRDGNSPEWVANAADKISEAGSGIGSLINEHKTFAGIGCNLVGIAAGIVVTAFAGPVVGGAVSGALMNVGSQIMEKGTDISWKEVAVSAAAGGLGAAFGAQFSGVGGVLFDTAFDTLTDITKNVVNGEKMSVTGIVGNAKENFCCNVLGAGLSHEIGKVIDIRQARKFADAESNLISQERANLNKCKRICESLEVEARKAEDDWKWARIGATAKQRENAISGAIRHEEAVKRLEEKYIDIATQSGKLREGFREAVKLWRQKANDVAGNFSKNTIEFTKTILNYANQGECA